MVLLSTPCAIVGSVKVDWITPNFYEDRPCPQCGSRAQPRRPYVYEKEPPFQAVCQRCRHHTEWFPTWREALRAFYGELPGRFGGGRAIVCHSIPEGSYPLREGLEPGDVVKLIDFHVGYWTVQRERDGLESVVFKTNIEKIVE